MRADGFALLRVQARGYAARLRNHPPQRIALVILVVLLMGYVLNTALFQPLWSSYTPGRSEQMVARLAGVAAAAVSAYAYAFSVAFPAAIQDFAHRISPRGLVLNRCIRTGFLSGTAATALVVVMAAGTDLGPVEWMVVLTVEIPTGVVIGMATAMLSEGVARTCTQRDAMLAVARILTMSSAAVVITVLIVENWLAPWLFLAGTAVVATSTLAGVTPVRPEWLVPSGRVRTMPRRSSARLIAVDRVGFVLLWRDHLAVRASLGMVSVIGLAGYVVRTDWNPTVSDLYLAGWPLLLSEIAGAAVIPTLMKQIPAGGGLYGHRWRPGRATGCGLVTALGVALFIAAFGLAVTSVTTGIVPSPAEVVTLGTMVSVAGVCAFAVGTLWKVAPDAVDLPMPLAMVYLASTAALVSLFNSAAGPVMTVALVALAVGAAVAVVRSLRHHAPFTV
jgi:hypothetical protein